MRIIGLTGGMASGKSTVSEYLAQKNIPVIDCDKISREALLTDGIAYDKTVSAFGKEILNEDKTVNRKKLASIVFADNEKLKLLNSVIHPAVEEYVKTKLAEYKAKKEPVVVVDAPLLIESGINRLVTEVWVVYAPESVMIERAVKRDNSTVEQVRERIKQQMPLEEKKKSADYLIENGGTLQELYNKTEKILERE